VRFGIFLEAFIAMTAHFDFVAIFLIVYLGAIIQSTLDEEQTSTHAKALSDLTSMASSIVGMLNQDDNLTFLRIRSKQREIMVSILEMGFTLLISLTRSQCFDSPLQDFSGQGFSIGCVAKPQINRMKATER
jgi:hypothetical protein